MARDQCLECDSLRAEQAKAEATFRPKVPGGSYVPDWSGLTDARVKIRRHAEVCPTAPLPAKIVGAL